MALDESEPQHSLVALKSERDETIRVLSSAYAADLLDIDEFDDRVGKALEANTCEALILLRADVEGASELEPAGVGQTEVDHVAQEALARDQPESKWAVAVMGGYESKGQWRVPKKLRVSAIMGGCDLDFREALIAPGVTEIKIVAMMGGVDILVPPNINVECEGIGILGGFEYGADGSSIRSNRPTLRISGLACFGGVSVETRLPGESAREAKKRRKRAKKALRAEKRAKQLGK